MPQFSERIECLVFRKSFNETLFNIDQQLDLVEQAAQTLRNRCVHVAIGVSTSRANQQLKCRNWVRIFCTHAVHV